MGEPLSSDRVFGFLEDEPEPHPAYDFFAPRPLPGYAGNPNNNNGWLEVDDYLLGDLEAMVDEPMVVPAIEEVAEPVAESEKEQVIAPVVDIEEDLAALFGDDDFEDDASDVFDMEEVWEVNEEWLMAPVTPPPMLAVPLPSVYEVGDPSTAAAEGPSFPHSVSGLLVSDVEVAAGVTIGELGLRVYAVEGQVQVIVSQMAHAVDRWEQALQIDVQQRDTQIQQLQATVSEMSSRESSLMQCILGLDRRITALERRPPGP
ncbi:hypothetical protein Tco_0906577 [Tanacetum coccineum]|uniref:Uncharacterized protein n=1 Tax=Tanacetum coccineum TaxID=301880 RepID=A0ABQ5CIC3_9ASTR